MTMQHMGTKPRTTTHTVDAGYYTASLSVVGFVETDRETYLGELLGLAQAAYYDVFKGDFEEAIVDMYRHVFEREAEEAARPTEFDLGFEAGKKAGRLQEEADAALARLATEGDAAKSDFPQPGALVRHKGTRNVYQVEGRNVANGRFTVAGGYPGDYDPWDFEPVEEGYTGKVNLGAREAEDV